MRIEAEPIQQSWRTFNPAFLERVREQRKQEESEKEEWRRSWRDMVVLAEAAQKEKRRAFRVSWRRMVGKAQLLQNKETRRLRQLAKMEETALYFCESVGFSLDQIRSPRRHPQGLVFARQNLYWILLTKHTGVSLMDIARFLDKHHSSVITGVASYKKRMGIE